MNSAVLFIILLAVTIIYTASTPTENYAYETMKLFPGDTSEYDQYSKSIDIYGNYAIIGAPNVYWGEIIPGSVYIYQYNNSWEEIAVLTGSSYKHFGSSVTIYDQYIAIGAPRDGSSGNGLVYIYQKDETDDIIWTEMDVLEPTDDIIDFGYEVSMNDNYILIGSYPDNVYGNKAYIFKKNNETSWTQIQQITPDDINAETQFGKSIYLDEYGQYILIGAPFEYISDSWKAGTVYVYKRNVNETWSKIMKLISSDIGSYNYFGTSISMDVSDIDDNIINVMISEPGNRLIYFYELNRTNDEINLISSLSVSVNRESEDSVAAMNGDYLVFSTSADPTSFDTTDSNNVTLYNRNIDTNIWSKVAMLVPSDGQIENDYYGYAISISENNVIISRERDNTLNRGDMSGSAYYFDIDLIPTLSPTTYAPSLFPTTSMPSSTPTSLIIDTTDLIQTTLSSLSEPTSTVVGTTRSNEPDNAPKIYTLFTISFVVNLFCFFCVI